jgi:3-methyladenine DNA glycosylase AlkD
MEKDEVKSLAKLIYEKLKEYKISQILSLISEKLKKEKTNKLQFTKTSLLTLIGQKLGKLLIEEKEKFEKLKKLWEEGKRDEKLIVISALEKISKNDYENSKQFVLKVYKDISDWEVCDQLALRVVTNLAVHNQEEIFSLMKEWIKSEDKWVRRLAVATIPPFIRAKSTEIKICLEFLDKLMEEKDKDVKKAIGWALREITKKSSEAVFNFLKKWTNTQNKDTIWIIKEGMKKLSSKEQEKLRFSLGNYDK